VKPKPAPKPQAAPPSEAPRVQAPVRIPRVEPVSLPPDKAIPFDFQPWMLAVAAAILILLVAIGRLRARPSPVAEIQVEDFDASLDAVRNQVLADPRVTADVVKLWMRA